MQCMLGGDGGGRVGGADCRLVRRVARLVKGNRMAEKGNRRRGMVRAQFERACCCVRALEGDAPLFVAADFFNPFTIKSNPRMRSSTFRQVGVLEFHMI